MATLADVTTQNWQLSAAAPGEIMQGIADVAQCIDTILMTERGSDPFRPDFGLGVLGLLDRPINEVTAELALEVQRQIERWETRVTITNLRIVPTSQGGITITLTWNSALGVGSNTATF
jgi:phage baseplate assembly protein W